MDCDCDVFTLKFCQRHKAERESAVHARISALREELGRARLVIEVAQNLAASFSRKWAESRQVEDHMVTMDHKDEYEFAKYLLEIHDALAKMGEGKPQ